MPLLGLAEFRDRLAMVSPWIGGGNLSELGKTNRIIDRCKLVSHWFLWITCIALGLISAI